MTTPGNKQSQNLSRIKILVTAFVTILILALLLFQHFNGGVPSHHILDRSDLPKISNWWGGLLLPVITWFLLSRIKNRLTKQKLLTQPTGNQNSRVFRLFVLGLVFGILLAVSFVHNYKIFLDNVLYILLALAILVPIFYAEFILGFILGMTYTFGAILPTFFMLIMAAIGFLIYRFLRPLFTRLINVFGKKVGK